MTAHCGLTYHIVVSIDRLGSSERVFHSLVVPTTFSIQENGVFPLIVSSSFGYPPHRAGCVCWKVLLPAPVLELSLVKLLTSKKPLAYCLGNVRTVGALTRLRTIPLSPLFSWSRANFYLSLSISP